MDASFDGGMSKRAVCGILGLRFLSGTYIYKLSATLAGLVKYAAIELCRAQTAKRVNSVWNPACMCWALVDSGSLQNDCATTEDPAAKSPHLRRIVRFSSMVPLLLCVTVGGHWHVLE